MSPDLKSDQSRAKSGLDNVSVRHGRPTGHETVFEFDPVGYFGVTRPLEPATGTGPFRIVGCPGRRENLPCTSRRRCLASRAPFGRVGSSVVEQRPFKPLVVGSNPTR